MAIKQQTWAPDTCGCKVIQVYDDTTSLETRVLSYGGHLVSCAAHAGIADNAARYEQMRQDNRSKNLVEKALHAVSRLVDTVPGAGGGTIIRYKPGIEYRWTLTGVDTNRTLTVTVIGVTLSTQERAAIQAALASAVLPVTVVIT